MEDISFKNFIDRTNLKVASAVELGCGTGEDTNLLLERGAEKVIAIDKKDFRKNLNGSTEFIEGNYFDEDIKNRLTNFKCDLLFSCYSLCFNTQKDIEENLIFYVDKIKTGGVFYILDFTSDEKVVTKRTNLWNMWLLSLLKNHFDHFEIRTQDIYEDAHQHSHSVFELVCFGKK